MVSRLSFADKVVNATIESISGIFGERIKEAVPKIFNGAVRDLLSRYLNDFVTEAWCPNLTSDVSEAFVDFRQLFAGPNGSRELVETQATNPYGDLFWRLKGLLDAEVLRIDPETGLSSVNDLVIAKLTEAQSGTRGVVKFEGDLMNTNTRVNVGGLDARVKIRVNGAYIENIDSLGAPLALVEPVENEPHLLNNTATLGVGDPVALGVRLRFELIGSDTEIVNEVDIRVSMSSLNVVLIALLRVAVDAFASFPVGDILNSHCWLALMPAPELDRRGVRVGNEEPSLAISNLIASVARLGLNVTCIECSSPGMAELTTLLSTADAQDAATVVGNDILDFATRLLSGQFLQVTFDRMLNDAQKMCPHSPSFDPIYSPLQYEPFDATSQQSALSLFIALAITVGSLAIFAFVVVMTTKFIVRRRSRRWRKGLSREKILLLAHEQQIEKSRNEFLNSSTKPMFQSDEIPRFVRWTMPIIILGNVGLFLSGHLSLGASVNIVATFADQSYEVMNFFEFSMAYSVVEIWEAGGKELAILILIFSGVWPYTKQLMTLGLWFMPTSRVTVHKRGQVLQWLDILAKYSMVDIFVLVVTVAGFRVSVQSPDVKFLPEDFYSLDLLVVPKWGLYANMIAQLVSQISSHFIIHYHRRVVEEAFHGFEKEISETLQEEGEDNDAKPSQGNETQRKSGVTSSFHFFAHDEKKERLRLHGFARPHRGESDRLVAGRSVNPTMIVLSVAICILIILGCVLPVFSLETLGIIGVLVESGQNFESAASRQSLFSIINLLFQQAAFTERTADYIGLASLSILLILTVLVVPIAQVGTLLYQWFRQMNQRTRHRLSVAVEILQAWQYAEVFLLAVVIACW